MKYLETPKKSFLNQNIKTKDRIRKKKSYQIEMFTFSRQHDVRMCYVSVSSSEWRRKKKSYVESTETRRKREARAKRWRTHSDYNEKKKNEIRNCVRHRRYGTEFV